jgi:uncharacterized cofD-like protein
MTINLAEHLIASVLNGSSPEPEQVNLVQKAQEILNQTTTEKVKVVILGGGSGLSNVLGGDSRNGSWPRRPFAGIKEIFPLNSSIVCVTDDGGSTGELLKDLPLIALGDLRHVLLSSITSRKLQETYRLSESTSRQTAEILFHILNSRFTQAAQSTDSLLSQCSPHISALPASLLRGLSTLLDNLLHNQRFSILFNRPHCIGNLLLVSAIYQNRAIEKEQEDDCMSLTVSPEELLSGINHLAELLGSSVNAVLPCTTTPARLKILYNNGVLITGEYKSAYADRGYPVDRLKVEFSSSPVVLPEVLDAIENADIILLAPGSLYTSTIPVLQVPGIAETIRKNQQAMKVLISNLWVQKGETDLVLKQPGRRFHVSDLINAYQSNIPAGVRGLFKYVLSLGLKDIPGSILQNYAVEGKIPIYLDKANIQEMGFLPIEAGIFSQRALQERKVVHHEPDALALSVKALWAIHHNPELAAELNIADTGQGTGKRSEDNVACKVLLCNDGLLPCQRYKHFSERINGLQLPPYNDLQPYLSEGMQNWLLEIFWRHADIPLSHLNYIQGIRFIPLELWKRNQQWDNVFSFYDPEDSFIKLRDDLMADLSKLEGAFLVALGQSLLGNYAENKELLNVEQMGEVVGKMYRLTLRKPEERTTFFGPADLDYYLQLVRMKQSQRNKLIYTRLNNGTEGFTPPGLLLGLMYAWYLDNRFAAHIEYKMAIMRNEISNLIPEQIKMLSRRRSLINFFREKIFGAGEAHS